MKKIMTTILLLVFTITIMNAQIDSKIINTNAVTINKNNNLVKTLGDCNLNKFKVSSTKQLTGNSKIDNFYFKIITLNNKKILHWANTIAKQNYRKKIEINRLSKLPSGLKFESLNANDIYLLNFLILAEKYRIINEKINKLRKTGKSCKDNKMKELMSRLNQTREMASRVIKKQEDTENATLSKIE